MTDAAPIITNFKEGFHTGDDKDILFTVYQPGTTQKMIDEATASRQDTSGYTFEFALEDADGVQVISITDGVYLVHSNDAQGEITVKLRNGVHGTEDLAGRYRWAMRRTNAASRSVGGVGEMIWTRAATSTS